MHELFVRVDRDRHKISRKQVHYPNESSLGFHCLVFSRHSLISSFGSLRGQSRLTLKEEGEKKY